MAESSVLRFGVIPDAHGTRMSDGRVHAPVLLLDAIVRRLLELQVDLVLAVGDLSDKRTQIEYEEWIHAIEPLLERGIPVYPVRGNHDLVNGKYWPKYESSSEEPHIVPPYDSGRRLWEAHTHRLVSGPEVTGMPGFEGLNYYWTRRDTLFIGIDLYFAELADNVYGGEWLYLYPWLKEVLTRHGRMAKHVVVFGHEPFSSRKRPHGATSTASLDTGQLGSLRLAERIMPGITEEVLGLFAAYQVHYICGHDHQYAHSLIHSRHHDPSSLYFNQYICGSASWKSYTDRYGICQEWETGIAHDRFDRDSHGAKKVVFPVFEVEEQRISMICWHANHDFSKEDQERGITWDRPDWNIIDRFVYHTDAARTLVQTGDHYGFYTRTPADQGFIGTSAAILDGYNHSNRPATYGKLLSMNWVKMKNPVEGILSDVIEIHGISETEADDDFYVLSISLPQGNSLERMRICRFDEAQGIWLPVTRPDQFVPTGYHRNFAKGELPMGCEGRNLEPFMIGGCNYYTNSVWGFVSGDGTFAVMMM